MDYLTEFTLRMAKKFPLFARLMQGQQQVFQFLLTWLFDNEQPPAWNNKSVDVYKPSRWRNTNHSIASPYARSVAEKHAALQIILEGTPHDDTVASDSEEDLSLRVFKMGQLVDLADNDNKWWPATISAVRQNRVKVSYNGFPSSYDEWLDVVRFLRRFWLFKYYTDTLAAIQ
jgi:hypothetical protein